MFGQIPPETLFSFQKKSLPVIPKYAKQTRSEVNNQAVCFDPGLWILQPYPTELCGAESFPGEGPGIRVGL